MPKAIDIKEAGRIDRQANSGIHQNFITSVIYFSFIPSFFNDTIIYIWVLYVTFLDDIIYSDDTVH